MNKGSAKVSKVMKEFKSGDLKSSSGSKVTSPKQAIVIALSESGQSKPKLKEGGEMKESKAMMKKEVGFMKKKGAPAAMIKHEQAEMAGMKKGGKVKKYAAGGLAAGHKSADGIAMKGKTKTKSVAMKRGGMTKAC